MQSPSCRTVKNGLESKIKQSTGICWSEHLSCFWKWWRIFKNLRGYHQIWSQKQFVEKSRERFQVWVMLSNSGGPIVSLSSNFKRKSLSNRTSRQNPCSECFQRLSLCRNVVNSNCRHQFGSLPTRHSKLERWRGPGFLRGAECHWSCTGYSHFRRIRYIGHWKTNVKLRISL